MQAKITVEMKGTLDLSETEIRALLKLLGYNTGDIIIALQGLSSSLPDKELAALFDRLRKECQGMSHRFDHIYKSIGGT